MLTVLSWLYYSLFSPVLIPQLPPAKVEPGDPDYDPQGRLTRCPYHGRRHLKQCGFNEYSSHSDGTHGHTFFYRCSIRGCPTVIPDRMDYYPRVHPVQLEMDRGFARECGGELWEP